MLNIDNNLVCNRCKRLIDPEEHMFTCRYGDYHGKCWRILKAGLKELVAKATMVGKRKTGGILRRDQKHPPGRTHQKTGPAVVVN